MPADAFLYDRLRASAEYAPATAHYPPPDVSAQVDGRMGLQLSTSARDLHV